MIQFYTISYVCFESKRFIFRKILLKNTGIMVPHCPVQKTASNAVYPLTDDSPYTIYVHINYNIMPVLLQLSP
jgi:hypothetical protein